MQQPINIERLTHDQRRMVDEVQVRLRLIEPFGLDRFRRIELEKVPPFLLIGMENPRLFRLPPLLRNIDRRSLFPIGGSARRRIDQKRPSDLHLIPVRERMFPDLRPVDINAVRAVEIENFAFRPDGPYLRVTT